MTRSNPTVTLYEVTWNDGTGGGPADDGSRVTWFRTRAAAVEFARGKPGIWGHGDATVRADEVPQRIAARRGIA